MTVKIQGEGYLLGDSTFVPKCEGNRHYEEIKQWISEGNTPEPEFTKKELTAQKKLKEQQEAQAYLDSTKWISEKFHDVVVVLKTMSESDFIKKYSDVYKKREEARVKL